MKRMTSRKTKQADLQGGTGEVRNGSTAQSDRPSMQEAFPGQQQLRDTRDYAEAIIEAVPPLLVLDQNLRVQTANQSFCKCFNISSRQALNRRVYELGNGQWNIP